MAPMDIGSYSEVNPALMVRGYYSMHPKDKLERSGFESTGLRPLNVKSPLC